MPDSLRIHSGLIFKGKKTTKNDRIGGDLVAA